MIASAPPAPTTIASADRRPWLGVELRHLATFAGVAEHRSFRAAARALGYSPPAVSQHVGELERLVGSTLVDRQAGSGTITLTAAGTALLAHAQPILSRFAAAQADLAAVVAGDGVLRLGVSTAFPSAALPAVLTRFAAEHPAVRLNVTLVADDDALARHVERCAIDVAFGGPPPAGGPFAVRRLGADPLVLAASTSSDLARRTSPIGPAELERQPLIDHGIAGLLHASGVHPRTVHRAASAEAALALVAAGLGVTVVPEPALGRHAGRVVAVSLEDALAPRTVVAYVNGDRRRRPEALALVAAAAATRGRAGHAAPVRLRAVA